MLYNQNFDFLQNRCSTIGELPQLKRNSFASYDALGEYMLRRVRMKKGLLHAISPDPSFDWSQNYHEDIRSIFKKKMTKNSKKAGTPKTLHKRLPITPKTFSKLGVEVQLDRRLCLAGQKLRGFLMPKRRSLQVLIMKGFLKWYSSCIQLDKKSYDIDRKCFEKKETKFLKLFMKSRNVLWRLVMPSYRPHFHFN